ncbi:hypothetical protein [Rhizohabitans arisaemae]|uniref:hypothetical protein n=1 Tax=Rhizohabitans arisaemae TaxID=2720610 RepID=UPI0024B119EC|nr:hypothetical protein [Rhizohabitans arisaemae]
MAWLFVRLKLRLIAGGTRGGIDKKVGLVLTVLAGIFVALLGFALLALLRLAPADVAADVLVIVFAVFALIWLIMPLFAFGLDETLDPSRLALFPLTTRQLAAGLFAASVTGVWPIASLVVLLGGVAAVARGPISVLVGLVAVLLTLAFCVVAARALTTGLSKALRSRRGRDAIALAGLGFLVVVQLPNLLVNNRLGPELFTRETLGAVAGAFRWTPPGMAAHAMASDDVVTVVPGLAAVALCVGALGWLWVVLLRRVLVTVDTTTQTSAVRRTKGGRHLGEGRVGAVAGKELKYMWRDPRYRVGWFSAVVVAVIFTLSVGDELGVLFPITLAAILLGLQAANVFGTDGRAFWINLLTFAREADVRGDLTGRQLAHALVAVPTLTVMAVVAGAVTGDVSGAVFAWLAACGVLGVTLGAGVLAATMAPYSVPERVNAFGNTAVPGQGWLPFANAFGVMFVAGALVTPVVLPAAFGLAWVAPISVLYGLAVAWGGRRLAAMVAIDRLPQILSSVSRVG